LGYPLTDPIVGLLIAAAILVIVWQSGKAVFTRLLDGVDPGAVEEIRRAACDVPGVEDVSEVRARWLGHRLHADLHISVDEDLPTRESHRIGEEVRHALLHAQPKLSVVTVHIDPCGHGGEDAHDLVGHHLKPTARTEPSR
ncbi:MAG TPA: cation transporter dimerization domain-containing protein, partial [Chloroflexia bacterium]|nr:cation transporter dimerization domain-containing protein [Chloroflexia bacterium]